MINKDVLIRMLISMIYLSHKLPVRVIALRDTRKFWNIEDSITKFLDLVISNGGWKSLGGISVVL